MVATLNAVIEALASIGVPIARTEFRDTKQTPVPEPPYIIWIATENTRGGDATIGSRVAVVCEISVSVELYTDIADAAKDQREQLVRCIESEALSELAYIKFDTPIQGENLHQIAYEFKIVEKRRLKP